MPGPAKSATLPNNALQLTSGSVLESKSEAFWRREAALRAKA